MVTPMDMTNKKVIWYSQHKFTKARLCLTNPAAFCNAITGFVYKGKVVHVIYFDVDTISTGILPAKLEKCRLDGEITR